MAHDKYPGLTKQALRDAAGRFTKADNGKMKARPMTEAEQQKQIAHLLRAESQRQQRQASQAQRRPLADRDLATEFAELQTRVPEWTDRRRQEVFDYMVRHEWTVDDIENVTVDELEAAHGALSREQAAVRQDRRLAAAKEQAAAEGKPDAKERIVAHLLSNS